jgi:hypothetical protein
MVLERLLVLFSLMALVFRYGISTVSSDLNSLKRKGTKWSLNLKGESTAISLAFFNMQYFYSSFLFYLPLGEVVIVFSQLRVGSKYPLHHPCHGKNAAEPKNGTLANFGKLHIKLAFAVLFFFGIVQLQVLRLALVYLWAVCYYLGYVSVLIKIYICTGTLFSGVGFGLAFGPLIGGGRYSYIDAFPWCAAFYYATVYQLNVLIAFGCGTRGTTTGKANC